MQESPGELTTARTNVYMCLFIQKTSWSTSNTFLTRYRSGGTPNEPQPQGACELQGWRIEAPGLPALMLPVNARRWVLANNSKSILFSSLRFSWWFMAHLCIYSFNSTACSIRILNFWSKTNGKIHGEPNFLTLFKEHVNPHLTSYLSMIYIMFNRLTYLISS
jgi:hypothetical protein